MVPPPEDFTLWVQKQFFPLFPRNRQFAHFLMKFVLRKCSLLISLEDHDLQFNPFLNVPCDITNILIVRDPCNLFASRIRKASLVENPAYPKYTGPDTRVLKLWKNHALEYLGLTDHLENKVCIYFNSWFSNRSYRQSISQQLNLKFTDRGFSNVSLIGGGSSFDSTHFDGNNQMMDVLNRQRYLTNSERQLLENILADDEFHELAHRLQL